MTQITTLASVLEWMSLSHERHNSTMRNSLQILLVGELQDLWRARRSDIECNPFYQLQIKEVEVLERRV